MSKDFQRHTYSTLVYGISFNCSSDNPEGSTSSFLEGNVQENKSYDADINTNTFHNRPMGFSLPNLIPKYSVSKTKRNISQEQRLRN